MSNVIHLTDTGKALLDQVPEDVRLKFVSLPPHYIHDDRLTARAIRVLGAIAKYDRYNGNGQGCYRGRKQLAEETRLRETHVSDAISLLLRCGYITIECDPNDGRRRVQRVLYSEMKLLTDGTKDRSRDQDPIIGPVNGTRSRKQAKWVPRAVSKPLAEKADSSNKITNITRRESFESSKGRKGTLEKRIEANQSYLDRLQPSWKGFEKDYPRLDNIANDETMPQAMRDYARKLVPQSDKPAEHSPIDPGSPEFEAYKAFFAKSGYQREVEMLAQLEADGKPLMVRSPWPPGHPGYKPPMPKGIV